MMKKTLNILVIVLVFAAALTVIYFGLSERFGTEKKNEFYTCAGFGAIIGATTVLYLNKRKKAVKR